jgi:heme-degrading monooxygenase HmoA
MIGISSEQSAVTLINVFTVEPDRQQQLVKLLIGATENVMGKQPGYRSARIHRSLDGTKVAVYARWRSREAFEALTSNAAAAAHMQRARALASFEPVLYEVVFTHQATTESGVAG